MNIDAFVWSFKIADLILILMIVQFIFSVSSWCSLGRLRLSNNLMASYFIDVWLLLVVSYDRLYFSGVNCNFSFLISDFIPLDTLPFFLMSLAKGLSILFIFSKSQLLVSLSISFILLWSLWILSFPCMVFFF